MSRRRDETTFTRDRDNEVTVSSDDLGITLQTWDGCEQSAALLDPATARIVAAELVRRADKMEAARPHE